MQSNTNTLKIYGTTILLALGAAEDFGTNGSEPKSAKRSNFAGTEDCTVLGGRCAAGVCVLELEQVADGR